MRDFVIITDSSCDLSAQMAVDMGIEVAPLTVVMDSGSYANHLDERELKCTDFYAMLREGKMATTSAVNVDQFLGIMDGHLAQGKDILYIGFSTGLSATYQAATIAAEEMRAKYPEAKILTVDTLAASMGQGLLVYLAVEEKKKGHSIEEVCTFVEDTKLRVAHWITVDDLNHLKRGGRISATAAILGGALNVKPVLKVDDEGHLVAFAKARGRKKAIQYLADRFAETAVDVENQPVFLSHGDCYEDAVILADILREKHGVKEIAISFIGPVVGAHSGPGTLGLFFLATHR